MINVYVSDLIVVKMSQYENVENRDILHLTDIGRDLGHVWLP